MFHCRPDSLWSWNFQITGTSSGDARTLLNAATEDGSIEHAGRPYIIKPSLPKQYLGPWTMTADSVSYGEGKISSSIGPAMEIRVSETLLVAKCLPFSRHYDYSIDEKIVGAISPAHLLTRKSTIAFTEPLPELTQRFCFWMAALSWSRSSQD